MVEIIFDIPGLKPNDDGVFGDTADMYDDELDPNDYAGQGNPDLIGENNPEPVKQEV